MTCLFFFICFSFILTFRIFTLMWYQKEKKNIRQEKKRIKKAATTALCSNPFKCNDIHTYTVPYVQIVKLLIASNLLWLMRNVREQPNVYFLLLSHIFVYKKHFLVFACIILKFCVFYLSSAAKKTTKSFLFSFYYLHLCVHLYIPFLYGSENGNCE